MTDLLTAPTDVAAEWSVLAHMLRDPAVIGEVIGVPLEQTDFSQPDTRLIYTTAVERHYRGQPVDPLVIGELVRDDLAQFWRADPAHVGTLMDKRTRDAEVSGGVLSHAGIVKRLSTKRKIMDACYHALTAIGDGKLTPEEIGDQLSAEALQVTAGAARRSEIMSWMDVGREYAKQLQRVRLAKQQGYEIGVYTGLSFIDDYTTGIGPGELCFLAGEPGSGKTAVGWAGALGFASRQLARDEDKRVATLMISAEMNLYASTGRTVQAITGIDGVALREGAISDRLYHHILREWKNRENLPLLWNFASNFRLSQLRALVAHGIQKHNVGFVVIDHFRMLDPDRKFNNANEVDEARVRFLKENIAKDLNVAVLCLAHTVKIDEQAGRPRMSHLRGSGMIAAFADQIGFLWSPYKYMSDQARREMDAHPSDIELYWEKNRFGAPAKAELSFYADKMLVKPREEL
jgi:replicative DNA helicase